MRKYLFTLLAVISVIQVSAQSITGKVVDGKSKPVPYVSCVLRSLPDSAYVSGIVSNEDGRFEIPVQQGRYVIQFSYLGYKTIEKECSNGDLGTITLEENAVALQEVAVKGERPLVRMENNRLTYNVEAILEKKIVSNVHELLMELPSVMSLDGNSISLVGASSTTIIISGKISQLSTDQILDLLKSLPADEVEKVEVIYNAPPQWHVNGAVINVVMKKKKRYTLNGQIQGGWTNKHENSFNLGGTVFTSTPKWDFDVMYKFANLRDISKKETEAVHTVGNTLYDISSVAEDVSKEDKHSIYTNIGYKINDSSSVYLTYNGLISPNKSSEQNGALANIRVV